MTQDQEFDPTELTEKELLIQMNQQLGHIRQLLMDETELDSYSDSQDAITTYRCDFCGAEVTEDEREDHALTHGLPPGMDYEVEFNEIE